MSYDPRILTAKLLAPTADVGDLLQVDASGNIIDVVGGGGGATGPAGTPGTIWYWGSTVPSGGTGINSDFYLRLNPGGSGDGDVYEKVSGSWSAIGNILGPTGTQGLTGPTGAQGVAGLQGIQGVAGVADPTITANTQTGTSYTLVLTDAGKVVECNNASAVALTIPPNSSVAFPVGSVVEVFALGAGQVTITPGSGVTLLSDGSKTKTTGQYATVGARQRVVDTWVLSGDLTT